MIDGNYVAGHHVARPQVAQPARPSTVSTLTITPFIRQLIHAPSPLGPFIAEPRPHLITRALDQSSVLAIATAVVSTPGFIASIFLLRVPTAILTSFIIRIACCHTLPP